MTSLCGLQKTHWFLSSSCSCSPLLLALSLEDHGNEPGITSILRRAYHRNDNYWRDTCPLGIVQMSTTEIARNRILELEQQLAESKTQIVMLREYLEKLACLGNGTRHGNSVGNVLAIEALDAIDKDLSGYILCDAAPVRYIYEFKDYAGRTIWSSNLEHDGQIPTATIPLYKAMKP